MHRPLGAINLTRAPGSPPTGQIKQRPGIPILPSTSLVLLNQQLAIDPRRPSAIVWSGCRRQFPVNLRQPEVLKTAVFNVTETRVSISLQGLRPCSDPKNCRSQEGGLPPSVFGETAVSSNANICGVGCQSSATHACIAYLSDWHWRLPPRPGLR